jgi:hypothetical protein
LFEVMTTTGRWRAAIELEEQIVGEFDVGLVDLVDQQHRSLVGLESLPQLAGHDVIGNVVHPLVAELAVAQPRDRVVLIKTLLRLCRRFDVPGDQVLADAARDFMGEDSFAGSRLAFDEQGALERDRSVDGDPQILGRHIGVGTVETLHPRHILTL